MSPLPFSCVPRKYGNKNLALGADIVFSLLLPQVEELIPLPKVREIWLSVVWEIKC